MGGSVYTLAFHEILIYSLVGRRRLSFVPAGVYMEAQLCRNSTDNVIMPPRYQCNIEVLNLSVCRTYFYVHAQEKERKESCCRAVLRSFRTLTLSYAKRYYLCRLSCF